MTRIRHIGLVAGRGKLPLYVAEAVRQTDDDLSIISLENDSEAAALQGAEHYPLSKFGGMLKRLKQAGVTHVTLAGNVDRPDFATFKPDLSALRLLPGTIRAAKRGDDALLRHVMGLFEARGFQVVPPQALCEELLLEDGPIGLHSIESHHRDDALKAMEVVEALGVHDIGQSAVVANGTVLAVEAQEGTDAMLQRVAELDAAIRGDAVRRLGVMAKRPKPTQDMRVDLPTLGPKTVRLAAEAGLAGIIAESGQAFVIDRAETISLADELGLFVVGLPRGTD